MRLDRVIAVRNDKTVYRDGNECVKVFNENYLMSDVLSEALNQTRAYEAGINTPKVLEITAVNGKWAIVSEYIKGKTLEQLMEENPDKIDEYIELLVDIQLNIGSKASTKMSMLKHRLRDQVRLTDLKATTRYDLHNQINTLTKKLRICHGDLMPSNVIISEDGAPYIVDWSDATQGNMFADVANTYLLFRLNGDDSVAQTYLDICCEKTMIEKQQVSKWTSIVAAAKLAKCSEKEREFLLSLVDENIITE